MIMRQNWRSDSSMPAAVQGSLKAARLQARTPAGVEPRHKSARGATPTRVWFAQRQVGSIAARSPVRFAGHDDFGRLCVYAEPQ
jgi:hypothetical protein